MLSKWNRVVIYSQSYLLSKGNIGVLLTGEHQLFDQRSGDLGGICVDPSGNIYVADPIYNVIFKILPSGTVLTWAGKAKTSGNNGNNMVKASDARFNGPSGLAIDRSGNLYVADKGNNQIRKITPNQYVTLIAGSPTGASGFKGGIGSNVLFNNPNDVTVDRSGNIYVADTNNHAIRLIQNGTSQVNTVAGNGIAGDGYNGWNLDGSLQSILRYPCSVAAKPNGEVYIMDTGNYKVKLLNKNLRVLKFSGSGVQGSYLGDALTSQYNNLYFSDVDPSGNLYVIDFKSNLDSRLLRINGNGIPGIIRDFVAFNDNWIWEDGNNAVWEDGNNAVWELIISPDNNYVAGVAVNNSGILYVTESEYGAF
jgi:sugar lactone lactonase YvrE